MLIHEITLREAVLSNPGANVFGQMAQQLAPQTATTTAPAKPGTQVSSRGGTITPSATGLVHTASERNPNPRDQPIGAQQKWDIEHRKLRNQFPGLTNAQYQQAMQSRTGTAQRPGGPAPAATASPAPTTAVTTTPTVAATPTPVAAAPETQYPPITLGTGPKAQIFVNKGRGYVDSKTNKPIPLPIVKALGLQ